MKFIKRTALLLCVLTSLVQVKAQQRFLPAPDPADTAIRISLLTCAPGSEIYELEGHSGLRLQYSGNDITVNWGLFDFASPGFVYRFVKGETDYSVGAAPTEWFLEGYRRDNRRVTQQTLNLTAGESVRIIDLIEENLRPENRIYRYNYVRDNCATRPLTMIEKAVGSPIELHSFMAGLGQSPTFRSEMRYFHANYPWYQFGIDLALGSGLDYQINNRLTAFAPVVLCSLAANATITRGRIVSPLVSETEIIVDGPEQGPVADPTPWYLTPLTAAVAVMVIALLLTWRDLRRRSRSRLFDMILFGAMALAGFIIAFLVFISTHEASSPNWLLLWLTPLALMGSVVQYIRRATATVRLYHTYNIIAVVILAGIFLSGVQAANAAFYPLMIASVLRSVSYIQLTRKNEKN